MRISDWSSDVCSSDLAGDAALATFLGAGLGAGGRIVELDRVRDGRSETGELARVPMWMLDCTQAWVLVQLVHFNTLAGVILLARPPVDRSEEHTSELPSLMRISYAVFCLNKTNKIKRSTNH